MADPLSIYKVTETDDGPFAEPGSTQTLGQRLKTLYTADQVQAVADTSFPVMVRDPDRFAAGVVAGFRSVDLTQGINSSFNALAEAADNRIETVRRQTGVVLENPFRSGYYREASERVTSAGGEGNLQENRYNNIIAEQRRVFEERLDQVSRDFPDKTNALQFYQPLEDQARAIAQGAEYDGEHADLVPALIGGIGAAIRDPVQVGAMFATGGESLGGTALSRIGWTALRQGLVNAGTSAIEQPAVQEWRADAGLRSGVVPSLENVGMNFVLGGVIGGAVHGAGEMVAVERAALMRLSQGVPQPGDISAAAKGLDVKIPGETAAAIGVAEKDIARAAIARDPVPEGLPDSFGDAAGRQAIRHAELPATEPPPALAGRPIVQPDVAGAEAAMVPFEARPLEGIEALRARPELVEGALRSGRPDLQQAGRLAALSDQAWGMVRGGQARPEHGVIVGEMSPDPIYDASVLARLTEARPETTVEARLIAADAIESQNRRMGATAAAPSPAPALSPPEAIPETASRAGIAMPDGTRRDAMDLVPMLREDGTVLLATPESLAHAGEEPAMLADLVRSCKT